MLLGFVCGILHVNYGKMDVEIVDVVPVDMVVNALICTTKEVASYYKNTSEMWVNFYSACFEISGPILGSTFLQIFRKFVPTIFEKFVLQTLKIQSNRTDHNKNCRLGKKMALNESLEVYSRQMVLDQ